MQYVYRNKNSGGEVTLPKRRPTFDESENWELVEGPATEVATVESAEQPASVSDPAELDDAALIDLFLAAAAALMEREDTIDESLFEDRREQVEAVFGTFAVESPEAEADPASGEDDSKSEAGDKVAGQTEIEATASAVKLAEQEEIDLRTVTGTGDEGRIVLDDVRKAVAQK